MTQQFRYDRTKSPAAPVLPVRIGAEGGRADAVAAAMVDTGADISVIPDRLARDLRLPAVDEIFVRGVTGSRRVSLYGAELEIEGIKVRANVAGAGTHVLIGRDVINRWTLVLRGPEETLELETRGPKPT